MKNLEMKTKNLADEKFKLLQELFPNAITETIVEVDGVKTVERAVDSEVLAQEINKHVVDGPAERYQFTWPDKRKSMLLANTPINSTLRPCREESVNFDETENLYIEGDNLDVLKLLRETYLGKVKMIYIDPPYNTGNDFVYEDDFAMSMDEYSEISGDYDFKGNRLVKNLETNGRFHTDWLNMMYPRLKSARDLLTDDGLIYISIDENELSSLKIICNEIFGRENFYGIISWSARNKPMNAGSARYKLQKSEEYVLVYGKQIMSEFKGFVLESKSERNYPFSDANGVYRLEEIQQRKNIGIKKSDKMVFDIPGAMLKVNYRWTIGIDTLNQIIKDGELIIDKGKPMRKFYRVNEDNYSYNPFWANLKDDVGTSEEGKRQLIEILGVDPEFETVKPQRLIKKILYHNTNGSNDEIIIDFFSGSATSAHAVMKLNAEDNGNRKFIMVQIPEATEEKSEAYRVGYKYITDIGKERIRRAAKKIKEENPDSKFDGGFRVLKLDSSNMKDIYYKPDELSQNFLSQMEDKIKADRTPEDLLFQVMLDMGVLLSSKIEVYEHYGFKIYNVADGFMLACFDENLTEELIRDLAESKPDYVVFKEGSSMGDSTKVNIEQIFKTISKDTELRIL